MNMDVQWDLDAKPGRVGGADALCGTFQDPLLSDPRRTTNWQTKCLPEQREANERRNSGEERGISGVQKCDRSRRMCFSAKKRRLN